MLDCDHLVKRNRWGLLGRDFWLFRIGQVISVVGDSCSSIALLWWILEKTNSALTVSSVLAPALAVKLCLMPILGPIGDRFDRKKIVVLADWSRSIVLALVATMVFLDYFNLPLLITFFILNAIGSAFFSSAAESIVADLVPAKFYSKALSQEKAIMYCGSIFGWVFGGLIVSFFSIGGAFLIDAFSFFIAGYLSIQIEAITKAKISNELQNLNYSIKKWKEDFLQGIMTIRQIPMELRLGGLVAAMNLFTSFIIVALPVLVKDVKGMPPWFLGLMEAMFSVGSVIGALFVHRISERFFDRKNDIMVLAGLVMLAFGLMGLAINLSFMWPLLMMFICGLGVMIVNIPIMSNMAMATPNEYRSRFSTVKSFMYEVTTPISVTLSGVLIGIVGVKWTLILSGVMLLPMIPLMIKIPLFSELMRLTSEKADNFYRTNYPKVFD